MAPPCCAQQPSYRAERIIFDSDDEGDEGEEQEEDDDAADDDGSSSEEEEEGDAEEGEEGGEARTRKPKKAAPKKKKAAKAAVGKAGASGGQRKRVMSRHPFGTVAPGGRGFGCRAPGCDRFFDTAGEPLAGRRGFDSTTGHLQWRKRTLNRTSLSVVPKLSGCACCERRAVAEEALAHGLAECGVTGVESRDARVAGREVGEDDMSVRVGSAVESALPRCLGRGCVCVSSLRVWCLRRSRACGTGARSAQASFACCTARSA